MELEDVGYQVVYMEKLPIQMFRRFEHQGPADILITEVIFPNLNPNDSVQAIETFRFRWPMVVCVVYTFYQAPALLDALVALGVSGIYYKPVLSPNIIDHLPFIETGGRYYAHRPDGYTAVPVEPRRRGRPPGSKTRRNKPEGSPFNESQEEVLALLSLALPHRLIGQKLGCRENTVKGTASQIYSLLEISGRNASIQAVRFAYANGWLTKTIITNVMRRHNVAREEVVCDILEVL
jgi:DNA-binding NarL/FixJ family response regulator